MSKSFLGLNDVGKIFISLNSLPGRNRVSEKKLKKPRYAVSRYAVTPLPIVPLRGLLTTCSQNIAKKSLNDADSFDGCQPSLSKLENRQRCQKP